MQTNTDEVRKELGVCMQYDVLFDHMTTKEHLLLYGQIKAPHWTQQELREQVRTWVTDQPWVNSWLDAVLKVYKRLIIYRFLVQNMKRV